MKGSFVKGLKPPWFGRFPISLATCKVSAMTSEPPLFSKIIKKRNNSMISFLSPPIILSLISDVSYIPSFLNSLDNIPQLTFLCSVCKLSMSPPQAGSIWNIFFKFRLVDLWTMEFLMNMRYLPKETPFRSLCLLTLPNSTSFVSKSISSWLS